MINLDFSHLNALDYRLYNEQKALSKAKTKNEIDLRTVWIAQIEKEIVVWIAQSEKEIACERKLLGLDTPFEDRFLGSEDELLAALGLEIE